MLLLLTIKHHIEAPVRSPRALHGSTVPSVCHIPTPPISSDVKLLLCDCVTGFSLPFLLGD